MGRVELLVVMVGFAVAVLAIVLLQRPAASAVDHWAEAHGLDLTPANRPMVTWYLVTARRLRRCGAVAGFLLPTPLSAALTGHSASGSTFFWAVVGYLAGAVWAEVALRRPLPPGPSQASLVPRDLRDYLPPGLRWGQRAIGVGGALLGVLVALLDPRPSIAAFVSYPSIGAALGLGAATLVVAGALEAVQRWLVGRRQPIVSADLLAADDAIRSQSVITISGAGIAILLVLIAPLFVWLGVSEVDFLRATGGPFAILCGIGALFAWAKLGHWSWRVRRPGATTLAGARM